MATSRALEIPYKLEAANFEELQLLIYANNVRIGGKVFYDIHPPRSNKGKWYAFYYEKVEASQILKERLNKLKGK
jgi:hypothetical protein